MIAIMLLYWPDQSTSIIYQIYYFGLYFYSVFLYNSIFFFATLCWIAYSMLDILGEKIKRHHNEDNKRIHSQTDFWRRRLSKWKAQYYWSSEYVHSINKCFGPFLLLLISCYFVRMVNNSFILLTDFKLSNFQWSKDCVQRAILLIKDFVQFSGFVYLPYLTRQNVITTVTEIFHIFLISFVNVGNDGKPKIRKITICRRNSTKSGK